MAEVRMFGVPVIVVALLLIPALVRADSGNDSTDADIESIRKMSVAIDRAFAAGDAAAMAALVTEDALWMPPEEPAIIGRTAIEKRYVNVFGELRSRFKDISHSLEIDEVRVCGDWAMSRGRHRLEMTLCAVPRTIVITGKNVHTYQRQQGGHWLITSDIWNSDEPLPRGPEQGRNYGTQTDRKEEEESKDLNPMALSGLL